MSATTKAEEPEKKDGCNVVTRKRRSTGEHDDDRRKEDNKVENMLGEMPGEPKVPAAVITRGDRRRGIVPFTQRVGSGCLHSESTKACCKHHA